MKLQTKALKAELQWVNRFVDRKSTIPILSTVLFDVDGDHLVLTGTDLEVAGVTSLDGQGNGQWSVAVPVRKLINYLDKVDEEEVDLTALPNNWLVVEHGASMRVCGMSKESFPELPVPAETQAVLGRLQLAVKRTAFATSTEESRFSLDGALLEIDEDEARLVATDGHRLSVAPLQVKGTVKLRVLIPTFALTEAGQFEEDCAFSTNDDFTFMAWGQRRIMACKLTGNFPEWRRIARDDFPAHIMLPVKSTLKLLERVAICADERSRAVRFNIGDGKLTLSVSSVEESEAAGTVAVQMDEGSSPLEAGYNADYISEFLDRTEAQFVAFCYIDAKSGAVLATGDGWKYYVMPMRI
jgi:DNA polymerase-3 subunit beta